MRSNLRTHELKVGRIHEAVFFPGTDLSNYTVSTALFEMPIRVLGADRRRLRGELKSRSEFVSKGDTQAPLGRTTPGHPT